MNINEIIKNRRATPPRFLAPEKIEDKIILQLLENANWAPNHKHTEPWRFYVYKGKAKQKLAEDIFRLLNKKAEEGVPVNLLKAEKLKTNIERVPVVIFIAAEFDKAKRIPEWEEVAAVAMAVQNMWLSATEMGLGAFWSTPKFLDLLKELLHLKAGQQPLGFFFLGHISMEYPSPGRGAIDDKIKWM